MTRSKRVFGFMSFDPRTYSDNESASEAARAIRTTISANKPRVHKALSGCRINSAVHFAPINAVSAKRNNSPAARGSDTNMV